MAREQPTAKVMETRLRMESLRETATSGTTEAASRNPLTQNRADGGPILRLTPCCSVNVGAKQRDASRAMIRE